MKFFGLTGKFSRLTLPAALAVLKNNKLRFFFLIVLSILLGALPAIKSEMEAAVIEQSANAIRDSTNKDFSRFLDFKLARLSRDRNDMDAVQRATHSIAGDYSVQNVFWIYVLLLVLTWLITIAITRIKTGMTVDLFTSIRDRGFKAVLEKEPYQLPVLPQQAGRYANAVHQGTLNITSTYGYIVDAIQYLFTLGTALVLLAKVHLGFTALFLVLLLLQVLVIHVQNRLLKKDRNDLDSEKNKLSAYTTEILDKKEIIMAFDQGQKYRSKLETNSRQYATIEKKLDVKESFFNGITNLVQDLDRVLIPLFVVFAILQYSIKSDSQVGDIYFVIALFSRLSYPAINILNRFKEIKKTEAISKSFLDILDQPSTVAVEEGLLPVAAEETKITTNAVEFSNVTFSYPGKDEPKNKPVLDLCTFQIPAGKVTLIVGPSGCGKSSIAKLILGYWKLQHGSIKVNGKDIDQYSDNTELRLLLSYVSQGDHIVEETVRENLNWSADGTEVPEGRMLRVLEQVELYSGGADKTILERQAKKLSGGEQQRLSLARMLLDDSPIIILDEPMTGVDVFTVNKVLPHLRKKMTDGQNTFIIISHKLLFVKYADHIILFNEDCQLEGAGTPSDLLAKPNSLLNKLIASNRDQLSA